MKVYVNDKEIEIFTGARIQNALLKYSKEDCKAAMEGKKQVTDKHGNTMDPGGELSPNQRLYVRPMNSTGGN
jgi:hypothetical protein